MARIDRRGFSVGTADLARRRPDRAIGVFNELQALTLPGTRTRIAALSLPYPRTAGSRIAVPRSLVIDQQGTSQTGSRDTLTLNLQPQARERVAQTGMRLLKRLSLKAGRYQVRVAARDDGSGAVGSVLYDLDVPDFNKPRLAISGLVVTSAAGRALPTVRTDAALTDVLPDPPMAARKFARTDRISMFVDVYDNDVTQVHTVDITTSLTSDTERVVFRNEEERSTHTLGGTPGSFGITSTLSLSDFEPGLYVFKVEARSRRSADVTASRDVSIQITDPK